MEVGEAGSWVWTGATTGLGLTAEHLRSKGLDVEAGQTVTLQVSTEGFAVPGWTLELT